MEYGYYSCIIDRPNLRWSADYLVGTVVVEQVSPDVLVGVV